MATSCITTPTATRTDVSTSESLSTTTTVSTSTLPDEVSTSIFRTCVTATATNATTCVFTDATTTITLPGNTTLFTVPVTVPIDIPITNIVTLFGSSCTTSPIDTPPVSTPDVTPPPDSTTTPPPTTTTTTTTPPADTSNPLSISTPTDTSTNTSTTPAPTLASMDNNTKKSNTAGPIAGGVIGGIVVLLFLGILTWKLIKKQRRFDFDDIFNVDKLGNNTSHYKKRTPESKTYNYGVIGQEGGHSTGFSPPNSPPPTQSVFGGQQASAPYGQQAAGQGLGNGANVVGQGPGHGGIGQATGQGGMGQGVGQGGYGQGVGQGAGTGTGNVPTLDPVQHLRNPSLTPLLAGISVAATAGATNAAVVSSSSSRPSTASTVGTQMLPNSLQGPVPGPSTGSSSSASMYPPALQSWAAAQTGAQSAGAVGSSSLGHTMSAASGNSMYTNATSGGVSAPYNLGNVQPMVPVVVGGGARNDHTHQQAQQYQQYADPFARSGSPVSVQEQRILQVTNADPSELSPIRQSYVGASSSSAGPSSGSAAGQRDGKGRPLNLQGDKPPIVHLDGGLYQEPEPSRNATPAPPAYTM